MKRVLRLLADYQCFPLWEEGSNVDPAELPLTEELQARLLAWAEAFEREPFDEAAFDREGQALWKELQAQLPDFEVWYNNQKPEPRLVCSRCGQSNPPWNLSCVGCGKSLAAELSLLEYADEEPPTRTAAYSQLLDIYSAYRAGELSVLRAKLLLEELIAYLGREAARFEGFPEVDSEDYREGRENVLLGLRQMAEASRIALSLESDPNALDYALALAQQAESRIGQGTAQLEQV